MASVINKINTGSTEYAIASTAYATCSTAASTPGKVAYILGTTATTGFTLTTGVTVYVKFTNTDTSDNSTKPTTLSINGCTAKPIIKRNNVTIAPGELQANCVYAFLYDGTNWQLVNGGPEHTHPISIKKASGAAVTYLSPGATYMLKAGGSSTSFALPSESFTVNQLQVSSIDYDNNFPLLMSVTPTSDASSQKNFTYKNCNNLYANPYSGRLTATTVSAGTFVATSDKRLKENIEPFTCEKSILELPVYTYNFIADDTKTKHIGCIAQELQEICPELVKEDEKGYLSINESKLVYLLLDEVKKLKAEVNQLKLDCKAGE